MSEAERLSEKLDERLAEKQSVEGNCEILRTMFQLRALSSNITARKGIIYFITLQLISSTCFIMVKKEKPKRENTA